MVGCRKLSVERQQAKQSQEGNMFSCLTPFFTVASTVTNELRGRVYSTYILTYELLNYWLNQRLNSQNANNIYNT